MNKRDRISKASYLLLDNVKRSVSGAIQELVRTGRLKIDKREVPGLVFVMMSMVESGYHTGYKDFMKIVDQALDEIPVDTKKNKLKRILGIGTSK